MEIQSSFLFKQLDPAKKDARWANNCIQLIRRNWVQLKSTETMRYNKQIIFGQQDMTPIIKMFKDKEFIKNTKFLPLGVWNRILNIIIEELTKAPPKAELKANDASALSDKEEDIRRLRLKTMHEKIKTAINSKIGEPPTIIGNDQFKTNIEEFYRAGLNPEDPEDIDFYEQNDFPRLKYEIAGQKIINAIMRLNRFDKETIRDFVYDIAAGLCCCMQVYVDQVSGEIKYDRIYPEQAYGVWGDKRDGSDDIGKGWVKNVTVSEWLSRVGNDFSFERDWMHLLWALNYTNKTKYTGFRRFGNTYDVYGNNLLLAQAPEGMYAGVAQSNLMDYSLAYTYNVYTGYIEWDSPEATATYLAKFGSGDVVPSSIPYDSFLDEKKEVKEYYKESWYAWRMYKSYFLPTSSTTQWIYNYGKLYMQELYGAYDQYCKGTCHYYRLEGNSAAEISIPYIEFANLCFYRLKWMAYHAKPQKEQHVIEELIKVSKAMQRLYPQNASAAAPNVDNILTQLIQYKRENFVDIRAFPEVEGKVYPVLAPQQGEKSAPDSLALWMQSLEQWLEQQIAEKVGLNDMRLGQIENAREGYKQNLAETQASLNSTSYFYRMIQYNKELIVETTLNYCQDIVRFKDTVPYKWLLKLMGEETFENSKILGNFASHRYSFTIEDFSNSKKREKLLQAADLALDKGDGRGGISIMEYGIILDSENYNDALRKLSLFRYKAAKRARKDVLELEQVKQNNALQLQQAIDATKDKEGQVEIGKANINAQAQTYIADRNAENRIQVKQMSIENEPVKQNTRSNEQMRVLDKKSELEEQKAITE